MAARLVAMSKTCAAGGSELAFPHTCQCRRRMRAEWLVEETRSPEHESRCGSAIFIGDLHGEGVQQRYVTGHRNSNRDAYTTSRASTTARTRAKSDLSPPPGEWCFVHSTPWDHRLPWLRAHHRATSRDGGCLTAAGDTIAKTNSPPCQSVPDLWNTGMPIRSPHYQAL